MQKLDQEINELIYKLKHEDVWVEIEHKISNYINKKINSFYIKNDIKNYQYEKEELYQKSLIKLWQCYQKYDESKNNNFFAWYTSCLDKTLLNVLRDINRKNQYVIYSINNYKYENEKYEDFIPYYQDYDSGVEIDMFKNTLTKQEVNIIDTYYNIGNQQKTAKELNMGQSTLSRKLKEIRKKYEQFIA